MVAVEVTDCDVTQGRGGHVDGLPGGETTPRDVDFGPVQRDNICAAVAVEVAEAKLASVLGHAIQEAPLRLAAGGKVPARARADEHVIDACHVRFGLLQVRIVTEPAISGTAVTDTGMDMPEGFYPIGQIAKLLAVDRVHLKRLIESGEICAVDLRGSDAHRACVRISRDALVSFIESRRIAKKVGSR